MFISRPETGYKKTGLTGASLIVTEVGIRPFYRAFTQFFAEEFNSSLNSSRHRPTHATGQQSSAAGISLSSPEIIKTVSRTLTPPVSPFHQLRTSNGERKSPSSIVHTQPGKGFIVVKKSYFPPLYCRLFNSADGKKCCLQNTDDLILTAAILCRQQLLC